MAEASLKIGGGNWGVKEDSLLGFNDENGNYKPIPFDFSRASIGTRVNRDGLIETVQDNIPRIDFTGEGSLLLEPQRTNLITYSEDFSQWSLANAGNGLTPILTSGYETYLGLSASRIIFERTSASTSNTSTIRGNDYTAGTNTFSIYIKSNTSNVTIDFRLGATITTQLITTEWQRVTFTGSDFYRSLFGFIGNDSDLYADLSIVAAQAEAGSYSTSLIPTSGSAVTRVADANNLSFADIETEGTMFGEVEVVDTGSFGTPMALSIDDFTNNFILIYKTNINVLSARIRFGGVDQILIDSATLTEGYHKFAFRYRENDCEFFVDGVSVGTDTSVSIPTNLNVIRQYIGGSINPFVGGTKQLVYFPTALTDSECIALTT